MNWIKRLLGIKEKEQLKLEDFSKKKENVKAKKEVILAGLSLVGTVRQP